MCVRRKTPLKPPLGPFLKKGGGFQNPPRYRISQKPPTPGRRVKAWAYVMQQHLHASDLYVYPKSDALWFAQPRASASHTHTCPGSTICDRYDCRVWWSEDQSPETPWMHRPSGRRHVAYRSPAQKQWRRIHFTALVIWQHLGIGMSGRMWLRYATTLVASCGEVAVDLTIALVMARRMWRCV